MEGLVALEPHLIVAEPLNAPKGGATPDRHPPGVHCGDVAALGRPLHKALGPEAALVHLQHCPTLPAACVYLDVTCAGPILPAALCQAPAARASPQGHGHCPGVMYYTSLGAMRTGLGVVCTGLEIMCTSLGVICTSLGVMCLP